MSLPAEWPPIKKAIWDCIIGAEMNAHYVDAWSLTDKLYEAIEAYLAHAPTSLHDLQGTPAGWRLVPVEPTEEMIDAARNFLEPQTERVGRAAYRAMLSAAPSPPAAVRAEPIAWKTPYFENNAAGMLVPVLVPADDRDKPVPDDWLPLYAHPSTIRAETIEALTKALTPFADRVFNDNGDMTIDTGPVSSDDFIAAYFALRSLALEDGR